MSKFLIVVLLLMSNVVFAEMTAQQAFEAGKAEGAAGTSSAYQSASQSQLSSVPNADQTASEQAYFNMTPAQLKLQGANKADGCSSSNETDPVKKMECQAILDVKGNHDIRPVFTIDPVTDPSIQAMNTIASNPSAVVGGSIGGVYSACVERTEQAPSRTETVTCNEYKRIEDVNCSKTLVITVQDLSEIVVKSTGVGSVPAYTSKISTVNFDRETNKTLVAASLKWHGDNDVIIRLNGQPLVSTFGPNASLTCIELGDCYYFSGMVHDAYSGDNIFVHYFTKDGVKYNGSYGDNGCPYCNWSAPITIPVASIHDVGNILKISIMNAGGPGNGEVILSLTYQKKEIVSETWDDGCAALVQ